MISKFIKSNFNLTISVFSCQYQSIGYLAKDTRGLSGICTFSPLILLPNIFRIMDRTWYSKILGNDVMYQYSNVACSSRSASIYQWNALDFILTTEQLSQRFVRVKEVLRTIPFYFIFSTTNIYNWFQIADKQNNGILFFDTDFISSNISLP